MQTNNQNTPIDPISEFSGLRFFLESLRIARERRHRLEGPGISSEAGFYHDAFRDRGNAAKHIAHLEAHYEAESIVEAGRPAIAETPSPVTDVAKPDPVEETASVTGHSGKLADSPNPRDGVVVRAEEFVNTFVSAMGARPRAFADVRPVHVLSAVETALDKLGQEADFTSTSRLVATLCNVYEKLQRLQAQSGASDESIMKSARREFLTILQARASFPGAGGSRISFR